MGLLSNLQPALQYYTSCKIASMAAELEKEDQKILLEAVLNPAWSASGLANELTLRNLPVSKDTIIKHRKRACSCWRN